MIVPEHFYDQRNNPLVKKLGSQASQSSLMSSSKVDILRLSHNVRKNMKRDQEDEATDKPSHTYNKQGSSTLVNMGMSSGSSANLALQMGVQSIEQVQIDKDDVSLNNNRRMVLNFGED